MDVPLWYSDITTDELNQPKSTNWSRLSVRYRNSRISSMRTSRNWSKQSVLRTNSVLGTGWSILTRSAGSFCCSTKQRPMQKKQGLSLMQMKSLSLSSIKKKQMVKREEYFMDFPMSFMSISWQISSWIHSLLKVDGGVWLRINISLYAATRLFILLKAKQSKFQPSQNVPPRMSSFAVSRQRICSGTA